MSETTKKIVLLVGAVVMALIAGEVALRAINYGAITLELNFGVNTKMALDQGRFLADPDLFWKMPPHPLDAEIRAIQPDVQVPAKGSAARILVLGDSCSKLSQQVLPYSALLEDSLAAFDVEVWNAAVPGYSSWQGAVWLQNQLLAIEPDIAIVYFGWNDHWRSTGTADADYAEQQQGSSLRLLQLFRKPTTEKPLRVSVAQYRENLTRIVADLRAQGAVVYLIAAPSRLTPEARQRLVQSAYLGPDDNVLELHREYLMGLKNVADATAAVMINVSGLFAELAGSQTLMMRDGIHLTDDGHRALAAILAEVCAPALESGEAVEIDQATLVRRARAALRPITTPEAP